MFSNSLLYQTSIRPLTSTISRLYWKTMFSILFRPYTQKQMFINPISISLKWPILIWSPLFEKQKRTSPWFTPQIRNSRCSNFQISKKTKKEMNSMNKKRRKFNVQKVHFEIPRNIIYSYISGELPGGSKGPCIGHITTFMAPPWGLSTPRAQKELFPKLQNNHLVTK